MNVAFIAYDSFNQKSHRTHDNFSEIRIARFEIPIVHILCSKTRYIFIFIHQNGREEKQ